MINEKKESVITINLKDFGGPVYSGRERGKKVRERLELDQFDLSERILQVIVPEDTYSITSSFFLGLFGNSIVSSASKDAFYKRYKFQANEVLLKSIDKYVSIALLEKKG